MYGAAVSLSARLRAGGTVPPPQSHRDRFLDWFPSTARAATRPTPGSTSPTFGGCCYNIYMHTTCGSSIFADITYQRLTDLKAWIRETGRGEATRFKTESYVRAAYREGHADGVRGPQCRSFMSYRIEKVPEHEIVTIAAELRRLMDLSLEGHPGLQRSRDMLLASFYMCGANFWDMWQMPPVQDGEVAFVRSKVSGRTQKKVHIRVGGPELEAILLSIARERQAAAFRRRVREHPEERVPRCKVAGDMLGSFDFVCCHPPHLGHYRGEVGVPGPRHRQKHGAHGRHLATRQ